MATNRSEVEAWLTDMDGVLVHENKALPGAPELIQEWTDSGTPFLVLTNNSIFTPRDLAARLRGSGLHVPEERIWTSALATADFCASQKPGGSAFVITIAFAAYEAALCDSESRTAWETQTTPATAPVATTHPSSWSSRWL